MQEFYASIKLKNGEEMLTIVTETCPEEDYIKVKNPIGCLLYTSDAADDC